MVKVVHLSDTHGSRPAVPDGDILIHTGDFSRGRGNERDCIEFNEWMMSMPHQAVLMVPGNHDGLCQSDPGLARKLMPTVRMLIDEEVTVLGLRIYGSPWSVKFLDWAFMKTDAELEEHYAIPDGLHILATHGPAYGFLDRLGDQWACEERHVGSKSLLGAIAMTRPKYVLCGHIHNGYGRETILNVQFLNSAIMDEDYKMTNAPQVFEIQP